VEGESASPNACFLAWQAKQNADVPVCMIEIRSNSSDNQPTPKKNEIALFGRFVRVRLSVQ